MTVVCHAVRNDVDHPQACGQAVDMRGRVLHFGSFNCGDWQAGDRVARDAKRVTCYRCRWKRDEPVREAAKRRAARQAEVRRPPRPRFAAVPGVCNLCGDPVTGRRRTWCSRECVDLWWLACSSNAARHHLRELHGNLCMECGAEAGVEVDHVRPLWSLTPDERTELRWWLPYNLQLLGRRCHKAKTAREAHERAAARRRVA